MNEAGTIVDPKLEGGPIPDPHTCCGQTCPSAPPSPGVISLFFRNDHYASQEAYLFAIAEAMRGEYEAIAAAGVTVQIDCLDLAMGRHIQYADLSVEEFRKRARLHVQVSRRKASIGREADLCGAKEGLPSCAGTGRSPRRRASGEFDRGWVETSAEVSSS
jgi:hypothetical protein